MSSNKSRDLPERLRNDPIFDGYISTGDKDFAAYTGGGISSQIDLSKFDKPLDNKLSDIQKAMLPKPKRVQAIQPIKKNPVKNIKQSSGKGKTLLKSKTKSEELTDLKTRLDQSIKSLGEQLKKPSYPPKVEKSKGLYRKVRREKTKLGLKKGIFSSKKLGGEKPRNYYEPSETPSLGDIRTYNKVMSGKPGHNPNEYLDNPAKFKEIVNKYKTTIKKGIKTLAGTGAGAALGGAVGGPIGSALGGVAGGTIGSAFEKPKSSSTSSTESNISKSQAYLKVEKSISRMQGYSPMTNSEVRKSFNGQIPEIMKDVKGRPPVDWWNKAISKSISFTDTPNEYAIRIWYNLQKSDAPWIRKTSTEEPRSSFDEEGKISELEEETGSEPVKKIGPLVAGLLGAGAGFLGSKLLGKCSDGIQKEEDIGEISNIEPEKLGNAIIQVIEELLRDAGEDEEKIVKQTQNLIGHAMRQASLSKQEQPMENEAFIGKAVAEPVGSKFSPKVRTPKTDFGGESEVSGDGSKADVKSIIDKSEIEIDTGN